jgi:hypothetical protein
LQNLGIHVSRAKTLVVLTFTLGLLLVSATCCPITLSASPRRQSRRPSAFVALVFMIVIHKTRIFLNACIIGTQIRARVGAVDHHAGHGNRVRTARRDSSTNLLCESEERAGSAETDLSANK